MTGAEVCDPGVINIWKTGLPEVRLINVYGPTEATIVCTAYEIDRADPRAHQLIPDRAAPAWSDRADPGPGGRGMRGRPARRAVDRRRAGHAGLLRPAGRDRAARGRGRRCPVLPHRRPVQLRRQRRHRLPRPQRRRGEAGRPPDPPGRDPADRAGLPGRRASGRRAGPAPRPRRDRPGGGGAGPGGAGRRREATGRPAARVHAPEPARLVTRARRVLHRQDGREPADAAARRGRRRVRARPTSCCPPTATSCRWTGPAMPEPAVEPVAGHERRVRPAGRRPEDHGGAGATGSPAAGPGQRRALDLPLRKRRLEPADGASAEAGERFGDPPPGAGGRAGRWVFYIHGGGMVYYSTAVFRPFLRRWPTPCTRRWRPSTT